MPLVRAQSTNDRASSTLAQIAARLPLSVLAEYEHEQLVMRDADKVRRFPGLEQNVLPVLVKVYLGVPDKQQIVDFMSELLFVVIVFRSVAYYECRLRQIAQINLFQLLRRMRVCDTNGVR